MTYTQLPTLIACYRDGYDIDLQDKIMDELQDHDHCTSLSSPFGRGVEYAYV